MVYIVRTAWSGLSGGPGINQLAFDADPVGGFIDAATAQVVVNAVRAFWNAQVSYLSTDISLLVSPNIDSYNTVTGNLVTTYTAATAPLAVTGTSIAAYSMASGYKINLSTAGVKNNRRVRGAIFMVPSTTNSYDSNGGVDSAVRTAVVAAGVTLSTALAAENLDIHVWSRPTEVGVSEDGSSYPITGMNVNSKVAVLRGRRG